MPSIFCGCINPCNCLVTEDGYFASRPQDGRRNTIVSGVGTVTNPLVIEFQQSEFYRPSTGEQQVFNINVENEASGGTEGVTQGNYTFVTIYESPGAVFVSAPQPLFSTTSAAAFGYFRIIGASASFASNATGQRNIAVMGTAPGDPIIRSLIAGNTQEGNTGGNTILSCAGAAPGILDRNTDFFTFFPEIANTTIDLWSIGVWQTSGGNLNIDTLKFWITMT